MKSTRAAVVEYILIEDGRFGQRLVGRMTFPHCALAVHEGTLTVLDEHGPCEWFAPAVGDGPGWYHAWLQESEEPGGR